MAGRVKFWLVVCAFMALAHSSLAADPVPGDVFREYTWYNEGGDAGGALRVGGRVGYEGVITLPHDFDLRDAVKAEVIIEKILCHDSTKGLAIEINGHPWMTIPESEAIPYPQWEYQHHIYPVVAIPLSHLKQGKVNRFEMRVDAEHPWKWPQNLIYGVHFRLYYDPAKKPHPTGKITSPASGSELGRQVRLEAEAHSPNVRIEQVDYVAHYEDVNFEGDGNYVQWHYHFFHGKIMNHIGSADSAPYHIVWDTCWVPDQKQLMAITARIKDNEGMIYLTEAVTDLSFDRPGISVELCRPYGIAKKWVTRSGEKEERLDVTGDLKRAVAAQLVWSSWSPGYMNGIYINGNKVFDAEGPKYQYYAHRVTLDDVSPFRQGVNILRTGMTPKIDGKMVHGMEVNWPGIMVLIQYADKQ